VDTLTRAEERVTRMLADGKSTKEVAAALGISINTVRCLVARSCSKAEVSQLHQLVAWWYRARTAVFFAVGLSLAAAARADSKPIIIMSPQPTLAECMGAAHDGGYSRSAAMFRCGMMSDAARLERPRVVPAGDKLPRRGAHPAGWPVSIFGPGR
jgi:DNA-binding CsgD family transcriptional regulator